MLSVVPVGPLIAGHPAIQTLHLVVSNAQRYNMFRITNMKFPGRKAFGGFGSGVSHVTKRRHTTGMGLPPTTDTIGRPARCARGPNVSRDPAAVPWCAPAAAPG